MSKKYDVLTFGDVCVDMILTDENIEPEFGQKEKLLQITMCRWEAPA